MDKRFLLAHVFAEITGLLVMCLAMWVFVAIGWVPLPSSVFLATAIVWGVLLVTKGVLTQITFPMFQNPDESVVNGALVFSGIALMTSAYGGMYLAAYALPNMTVTEHTPMFWIASIYTILELAIESFANKLIPKLKRKRS